MGASTARTTWGRRIKRGAAIDQARSLLAAGAELETTYETTSGTPTDRTFWQAALRAGHKWTYHSKWPCESELEDVGIVLARDDHGGVFVLDDKSIVFASIGHGWLYMTVAVAAEEDADPIFKAFSAKFPPLYREQPDNAGFVPVTFWTLGQFGPSSRMRMIEAAAWDDAAANYSSDIRGELEETMREFEPGKSGQLLLWQGPPGTGKTWALRALASEWRSWCEFHYITDPDAFFVRDPSYMIDVLLADTYDELVVFDESSEPEVVAGERADGKWRVLVLEDTGELLSATAKEQYGQGLSRVLNVVDGMVGQGLRVLLLITTNDELGDLHPAVNRPGRCAQQLEFGPLSVDEANEWLQTQRLDDRVAPVTGPATIAELYARAGGGELALESPIPTEEGIAASLAWQRDHPGERTPMPAHIARLAVDVVEEIRAVAEKHQPDEPAYGQAYWNAETRTVYWVSWDGTSVEEQDAAYADFLAIPGVEHVEGEAETARPATGDGWEQVYTTSDVEALSAVLSLAAEPLTETLQEGLNAREAPGDELVDAEALEGDLTRTLRDLAASGDIENREAVASACAAIAEVHRASLEAMRVALTASAEKRDASRNDLVTFAALDALKELARKPAPAPAAAPDVHVHVPKQDLAIHVDGPTIEAPPPADVHVHVPAQEAPVINMPEQPVKVELALEQADIHVHVPEVPPAQAPPVHVHMAAPPARAIRVEVDEDGNKVYVPEDV